jgi:hypothetical protein
MNLPATVVDGEAFAFACGWLERFRDNPSPWSDESGLTLEAGDGYWRAFLRQVVRGPFVNNRLQALAIARGGDADAIDVVNEFINEMRSLGAKLPTEFEAFTMDFTAGADRGAGTAGAATQTPVRAQHGRYAGGQRDHGSIRIAILAPPQVAQRQRSPLRAALGERHRGGCALRGNRGQDRSW